METDNESDNQLLENPDVFVLVYEQVHLLQSVKSLITDVRLCGQYDMFFRCIF